jgi:predicted DNA-binding transcriptional regulator YafY
MADPLEVELTDEQLHALCLAAAWLDEGDNPAPELAALRPALESVEESLLNAWTDLELAGWDAGETSPLAVDEQRGVV